MLKNKIYKKKSLKKIFKKKSLKTNVKNSIRNRRILVNKCGRC